MLIKPHHDRHHTTSRSRTTARSSTPPPAARRAAHRLPWTTVGTSCSNGRPRGCYPRAPTTPFDAEDRPPSPSRVTRQPGHHIFHAPLRSIVVGAPLPGDHRETPGRPAETCRRRQWRGARL